MKKLRRHRRLLPTLALHILMGTVLFCAVCAPAVLLNFLLIGVTNLGMEGFPLHVLEVLKAFLVLFDACAVVLYVAASMYEIWKGLFHE